MHIKLSIFALFLPITGSLLGTVLDEQKAETTPDVITPHTPELSTDEKSAVRKKVHPYWGRKDWNHRNGEMVAHEECLYRRNLARGIKALRDDELDAHTKEKYGVTDTAALGEQLEKEVLQPLLGRACDHYDAFLDATQSKSWVSYDEKARLQQEEKKARIANGKKILKALAQEKKRCNQTR